MLLISCRCKKGLKAGGYIVVKENVVSKGEFWLDKEDSSVVRCVLVVVWEGGGVVVWAGCGCWFL